jgi:hypothetical protein
MRIAFDLDGVLADLHGQFVQTALRLYPDLDVKAILSAEVAASPPPDEEEPDSEEGTQPPANVVLTKRQLDAVWKVLTTTPDFWEQLQEIEQGAIARIAQLAEERRWEVLFITSRPRTQGRTVQRQSQRWLQGLGFDMPSLYVVHGSRGRVADALNLDVVIDDRADNCLDVVLDSKAAAILVWRGDPANVPAHARRLGIAVAPTVAACLDVLVKAESDDGTGLLARLRKLFGIRTKSAVLRPRS